MIVYRDSCDPVIEETHININRVTKLFLSLNSRLYDSNDSITGSEYSSESLYTN